jgi:hypothetical protein
MLLDALVSKGMEAAEAAVVVSNDSDLVFPIKRLRQIGVPVGVINPHPDRPSSEMLQVATFYRQVKPRQVLACRFSPELRDAAGAFEIPSRWR